MGKDYRVRVTVRNDRILSRMEAAGFETGMALAKAIGAQPPQIYDLIGMRVTARRKNGEYRSIVRDVAAALGCEPDELFTERQAAMALPTNSSEVSLSEPEMLRLAGGGADLERSAFARQRVAEMLASLPPRERHVLEGRMEGVTLEELAQDLGVGRERIRQMEAKIHRRFRHPKWQHCRPEY